MSFHLGMIVTACFIKESGEWQLLSNMITKNSVIFSYCWKKIVSTAEPGQIYFVEEN